MIKKAIRKIIFFMGSVKLAVPTMLLLGCVVAAGTVIESRYNADYARMLIYQNELFSALLICLWLNILFATFTRWPWKRHHLGFLITHLGLLLLFGGGFLTNTFGVDGSLRVTEGDASRNVVLNGLMLSVRSTTDRSGLQFEIPRYLSTKGESTFADINEAIKGVAVVKGYMPFANAREVLRAAPSKGAEGAGGGAQEPLDLQFRIKSAFFDVEQGLSSAGERELQMGPAKFKLIREDMARTDERAAKSPHGKKSAEAAPTGTPGSASPREPQSEPSAAAKTAAASGAKAGRKLELKIGAQAKSFDLDKGQNTFSLGKYKLTIQGTLTRASVGKGGLQENPQGELNPALVVDISDGAAHARDVLFAKYPGFSLRKGQFQDLEAHYSYAGVVAADKAVGAHAGGSGGGSANASVNTNANAGTPSGKGEVQSTESVAHSSPHGSAQMENDGDAPGAYPSSNDTPTGGAPAVMGGRGPNGNEVRFIYSLKQTDSVRVELWKAGKKVTTQQLKESGQFTTPWMGMQITLTKLAWNAQRDIEVTPTTPQEKEEQLPPAALKIGRFDGPPSDEVWMIEGQERAFQIDGRDYLLYFGRKVLRLPFDVKLNKFNKVEYPGTMTAKEFSSEVLVSGLGLKQTISMNEPLHNQGYTVYQASYEAMGDGKFASIFSINYDPGRPFKYLGGIVLAIGIITYTLSKSRRLKQMGLKI